MVVWIRKRKKIDAAKVAFQNGKNHPCFKKEGNFVNIVCAGVHGKIGGCKHCYTLYSNYCIL